MKYIVRHTKKFKKDYEKVQAQCKDLTKLESVVLALREGENLNKTLHSHQLKGEYKDCMECYIEPDWLLIYRIVEDKLVLVRTGSHSELFK